MASGEIIFTPATILGTSGGANPTGAKANVFDGDILTEWNASNPTGEWVGLDAGAACLLTRIRWNASVGDEDYTIGAIFQGNPSDATFASGTVNLFTVSARPITGCLLNEQLVSPGSNYQYYRFLSAPNGYVCLGKVDFIGNYTTGVSGMCCTPTISPSGGIYDLPVRVSFSSLTTDATFYYTLDGSTPTTSSTLYTGRPFVLTADSTIKVIATSPNVANSKVAQTAIIVSGAWNNGWIQYDINRGYRV
jgi:chitobiase/beta-hexosaminidase-like protein